MESTNVKRRLTAILAADAVGYSQHTCANEEGTLRVLAAHRAIIDGIIAFHGGRIVSTAGDSVLAEFGSAVEAVRCAVEIQEALKTRNDALADEDRMPFRIGVNLGDVVVKNDDLLGDGVNVAARLEGIADPGGVCISSSVYDQITGKLNLGFEDIGEQNLKNISRPIRAYRLAGTGVPRAPAVATPARKGSPGPWLAGAIVLAAGLSIAAWKAGWFLDGAARNREAPTAASAPPAAEPGTHKATGDDTAAMRAKMDEEIARVRGDVESMKRAAEAELARAHAEADASRSARIKAEAEAAASRTKDEANALKRAAEAEMAKAEQARKEAEAESEKAKAAQTRKAAEPVQVAAATSAAVVAPRTAVPAGAGAYDGIWAVTRTCEKFQELDSFTDKFGATVRNDEVAIEYGARGQPGYMTLSGKVAQDGAVTVTGYVVARSKRHYGRETPASLSGTLAGPTPTLTGGWGGRRCTLKLVRTN